MQRRIDKSGTLHPTIFPIIVDSISIGFNITDIYVFSPNSSTITLVYITNTIDGATNEEKILDFYATTTLGQVTFNIDDFESTTRYQVRRGGSPKNNTTSDSSGYITFNNSIWSEQHFEVYRYRNHKEYYFEVG